MADVNKYEDLSAKGNVYGPLMKNQGSTSNNGATPVNPAATNQKPVRVQTQDASYKNSGDPHTGA